MRKKNDEEKFKPKRGRVVRVLPIKKEPKTRKVDNRPMIYQLLEDEDKMATLREMLSSGASFSTVSAALGYRPATLPGWFAKGQKQKRGPYAILRRECLMAASKAKHVAEAKLLDKSPEKWMERSTASRSLDTIEDTTITNTLNAQNSLKLGAQKALDALRVLRAQGFDLNTLIDKDELTLCLPGISSDEPGITSSDEPGTSSNEPGISSDENGDSPDLDN